MSWNGCHSCLRTWNTDISRSELCPTCAAWNRVAVYEAQAEALTMGAICAAYFMRPMVLLVPPLFLAF